MAVSRRAVLLGACGLGAAAALPAVVLPAAVPPEPEPPVPAPALPPPSPSATAEALADAEAVPAPLVGDARPYFTAADWLWQPIPADPALDPRSADMVTNLRQGAHVANMREFGVTLRGPAEVTRDTPRYRVRFSRVDDWGADPFGADTMPVPDGTPVPPGSDAHVAVADPARGTVYSLWQARSADGRWSASWGAKVPLRGDGRETYGAASTGSRLSRLAGVVRASEIAAGHIPHALFFSTDVAAPESDHRYPSCRSDGQNMAGVAVPVPEGARIQLDPAVDLTAIRGITPLELTVGRALQTYGAYCGDNGNARMGFLFEYEDGDSPGDSPGPTYRAAGATWDYFDLYMLPWDRLRVLRTWNGR